MIRELAARIGIGSARVRLELDSPTQPRGSEVRGRLILEGGSVFQRIEHLTVTLREFDQWTQSTDPRASLATRRLSGDLNVEPRSYQEFPFSFNIPDEARLTSAIRATGPSRACRIDARAAIAWAADPRATANLNVTVHREIVAIHRALSLAGFRESNWVAARHRMSGLVTAAKDQRDVSLFAATGDIRTQFDTASTELWVEGAWVLGKLTVKVKETTLANELLSRLVVAGTFKETALRILRAELLTQDGAPNSQAALPYIERILAGAASGAASQSDRLLRSADPPDPVSLLRAATTPPGGPEEALLRPIEIGGTPPIEGREGPSTLR